RSVGPRDALFTQAVVPTVPRYRGTAPLAQPRIRVGPCKTPHAKLEAQKGAHGVHACRRSNQTSTLKPRSTSHAAWPPRMPQFSRGDSRSRIFTWFFGIPRASRFVTIAR